MTLAALIRGTATVEPEEVATAIPAIPATRKEGGGGTVARIATVAVANHGGEGAPGDPLPDPAAEARRQRVLAMLAADPMLRLAVVCDGEGDPVPVAVALRDKGTCEVLIPAARFDPFALLALVERCGETVH